MPRSKTYLPDINFWLALVADSHQFHPVARSWFESEADAPLAFCRVTQMGFLRLITNPRVLGRHAVAQPAAWEIYERLEQDRRIRFAVDDAPGVPAAWKRFSLGPLVGRNPWTDAYLAAFAAVRGWQVVTFDRDFRRLAEADASVTFLEG